MNNTNETLQQPCTRKNSLLIPFLTILLGASLLFLTLFVPFVSATDTYEETLRKFAVFGEDESGMTTEDYIKVSLFEFSKVYSAETDDSNVALGFMILFYAYVSLAVLTTLFAIFKKPIPVVIFSILTFLVYGLNKWDFNDRGVITNTRYVWGISPIIFYIATALLIVGSIFLFVAKRKIKKQNSSIVK